MRNLPSYIFLRCIFSISGLRLRMILATANYPLPRTYSLRSAPRSYRLFGRQSPSTWTRPDRIRDSVRCRSWRCSENRSACDALHCGSHCTGGKAGGRHSRSGDKRGSPVYRGDGRREAKASSSPSAGSQRGGCSLTTTYYKGLKWGFWFNRSAMFH